ncbi:hypothetical protein EI77_00934 [Prosthecobacter fusiformis]|uniref:Uncharacterized protein n=1 Tax=Prosthecobacter fusiformis TaxID=48464 RepID=A0A4R7SRL9_9BACT|nr:hypothetical protein [Prosthecobacter fusiformis]TDU81624.1 hypothetical protein EI77_00934 [Prosthecobacter fusiformis]
MQADQHVQMVFNTTDPVKVALAVLQLAPDETKQVAAASLI